MIDPMCGSGSITLEVRFPYKYSIIIIINATNEPMLADNQ